MSSWGIKRILAVGVISIFGVAGCTSPENEGGTAIPSAQSGAPLADDAVGPSEQEAEIEE